MTYQFSNNASSVLALPITDIGQTTINLDGGGAQFPTPSGTSVFRLVIEDALGNYEVCECTARVGDQLTIVRAQEGTTAKTFDAGARVELRLTQAVMESFAQLDGFTMAGDIDMSSFELQNVAITSGSITGATIEGGVLRATDGGVRNELVIPDAGAAPTIGGNSIWHAGNDGPSSGLNADLLDGQEGAHYLNFNNFTNVPAEYTPEAHTHLAAEITDTILAAQLEANVLRHETETNGVVRIVTTAPDDADGSNGDIWLVVSA